MNVLQKELHFDSELVLHQIKHMGITQMVHIQKSGYSAKYTFKVGCLLKSVIVCTWYKYPDELSMKKTFLTSVPGHDKSTRFSLFLLHHVRNLWKSSGYCFLKKPQKHQSTLQNCFRGWG